MKKALVILLVLAITSCSYFDAKKIAPKTILNEELRSFNWNEIDTYPAFSSCDNLDNKEEKKGCFQTTISHHISKKLQEKTINVSQEVNDTIWLNIMISEKGQITLDKLEIDSLTLVEIPNLEKTIKQSVLTLPKVFPAIKRNQPVKTEFKLPIIVAVK